jgi:AcrR family transcriptional regulator
MSDKDEKLIKRYSNKITNKLTREAIYTALVILIKQKPFDSITVTDIVKKAGVSRTAYYNNYNTKKRHFK